MGPGVLTSQVFNSEEKQDTCFTPFFHSLSHLPFEPKSTTLGTAWCVTVCVSLSLRMRAPSLAACCARVLQLTRALVLVRSACASQLFYSFFKTLVGKEIAVELKNDVALVGTLHSVDQYLNIKLLSVAVVDGDKFPQLVRLCV